jgi:hypothetical protein
LILSLLQEREEDRWCVDSDEGVLLKDAGTTTRRAEEQLEEQELEQEASRKAKERGNDDGTRRGKQQQPPL